MAGWPEIDVYTPWTDPDSVARRHVGREVETDAIARAVRAFLAGGAPLPVFLFGPRGVGKSHLLTWLRREIDHEVRVGGARVVPVPEDIPEFRDPLRLLARVLLGRPPRYQEQLPPPPPLGPNTVLLWEGLGRQLTALGVEGRRSLRGLLSDRPWPYIIATGASLSSELVGEGEAFRGHFDARPLPPLGETEAGVLLERITGRGSAS